VAELFVSQLATVPGLKREERSAGEEVPAEPHPGEEEGNSPDDRRSCGPEHPAEGNETAYPASPGALEGERRHDKDSPDDKGDSSHDRPHSHQPAPSHAANSKPRNTSCPVSTPSSELIVGC